jgi:cell division protein FtsI/penicillin-binding protein 2
VAKTLRTLMRQVVTNGTAAPANLPANTGGKTGTAEFGTGDPLPTHAWFIGFRGDLAFAVLVEDGGVGGEVAAPVAARFLRGGPGRGRARG